MTAGTKPVSDYHLYFDVQGTCQAMKHLQFGTQGKDKSL